jgi:hypothetical protein
MEILEGRRNILIEQLSEQYSQNLISLEEYERLIEYSNKIETDKELILLEKIIEVNNKTSIENTDNEKIEKISPSKTDKVAITIIGDITIKINERDFVNNNRITITVFSVIGDIKIYISDKIEIINNMIHVIGDVDKKSSTTGIAGGLRKPP